MANRQQNLRAVDPVLTNLAVGYTNADSIADVLFPLARVTKEAGKIPRFNKDHFRLYNTERALRAKSNVMQPGDRDFVDVFLEEHDFAVPMDYREGEEADFDLQANNAFIAEEVIRLRREKMAADIAFNAANYAAANKITLSGTSQFTHASSDPVATINTGKEAVRQQIGREPNTLTLGAKTFVALKSNPALIDRIKYSQKAILTVDLLAQLLDVDRVIVGKMVYFTDAGVATDVWGDSALLTYSRPPATGAKRSVYQPNYGYTPYKLIGEIDRYLGEGGKVEFVRSTANFDVTLVGADAGYLISDTNV